MNEIFKKMKKIRQNLTKNLFPSYFDQGIIDHIEKISYFYEELEKIKGTIDSKKFLIDTKLEFEFSENPIGDNIKHNFWKKNLHLKEINFKDYKIVSL